MTRGGICSCFVGGNASFRVDNQWLGHGTVISTDYVLNLAREFMMWLVAHAHQRTACERLSMLRVCVMMCVVLFVCK